MLGTQARVREDDEDGLTGFCRWLIISMSSLMVARRKGTDNAMKNSVDNLLKSWSK